MRLDHHSNIKCSRAFSPANTTDDTAMVSQILDTEGFFANELCIISGSIADANVTFTLLLEEGDSATLTDAASVADANMIGTESGGTPLFSDDNKVWKLGYIGSKRYIRATLTPSGNTGDCYVAMIWCQGHPRVGALTTQKV